MNLTVFASSVAIFLYIPPLLERYTTYASAPLTFLKLPETVVDFFIKADNTVVAVTGFTNVASDASPRSVTSPTV